MPFPIAIITALLLGATVLVAAGGVWSGSEPATTEAALQSAPAGIEIGESGLPIPRFASLGSGEVNLRTGPGVRYPVAWVFTRKGLPVIITAEFEHWRKVRDRDGAEGWVHKSMLSGRRYAVVTEQLATLLREPETGARPVLRVQGGVLGELLGCRDRWCRLEVGDVRGWVHRAQIFGVLGAEEFD